MAKQLLTRSTYNITPTLCVPKETEEQQFAVHICPMRIKSVTLLVCGPDINDSSVCWNAMQHKRSKQWHAKFGSQAKAYSLQDKCQQAHPRSQKHHLGYELSEIECISHVTAPDCI